MAASPAPVPERPSRPMLALFARYLRWYIPRSFHALRLARGERFPAVAGKGNPLRLVVCLNHPSWWDPLMAIMLSRHLLPHADHYAPMEAGALRHYAFMRKLGLFPIDTASARSGAQFLRAGASILKRPDSVLWITPEGRFTDPRLRPLAWKPGLAALLRHLPGCTVVPLALEYPFWNEKRPEALALVGEPLRFAQGMADDIERLQTALLAAMTSAQDELGALATARDAAPFQTLLSGADGAGGVYALWKRAQAMVRGQHQAPEHENIPQA